MGTILSVVMRSLSPLLHRAFQPLSETHPSDLWTTRVFPHRLIAGTLHLISDVGITICNPSRR